VQGDKPAGVYSNNIATIIKRIATAFGNTDVTLSLSDIDTTNFDAFATAHPQPVGIYLSDRANVIDVCNSLAKSVGARLAMGRTGLLYLVQLSLPQASGGLTVTSSMMADRTLQPYQIPPVQAGVQIGFCKNYTVQSSLQTGLPESSIALFAEEWLTSTATDDPTATTYKLHTAPVMDETMLQVEADAIAEASRRLAMWKTQRKVMKYNAFGELLFEKLGNPQTLIHTRFNLGAGKVGQVIGLTTDWLNPHVEVEIII
jgi:hypothetical protein